MVICMSSSVHNHKFQIPHIKADASPGKGENDISFFISSLVFTQSAGLGHLRY